MDPVARKVLALTPWVLPNPPGSFTSTGPSNNLLANEFARTFFDDYNLRLDHQFSSAFKIYGSLTANDQSGFGRPKLIKEDLLAFDAVEGNYSPFRQLNTSVGYTWVIKRRRSSTIRAWAISAAATTLPCRRWTGTGRPNWASRTSTIP